MSSHRAVLISVALTAMASYAEIPDNPKQPDPGLELGTWIVEPWGNPGSTEPVNEEERQVLKLTFKGGKKGKAAFKHLTGTTADPDGKVRLHVYAPEEKNPKVSVALSTSPDYVWHESKVHQLNKGWNKIEISLGNECWKTEDTEWMYKTAVKDLNQIRALDFLVYNEKDSGWMYIEGFSLDLDETGIRIADYIEDLTSKDPKKRAEAEEELIKIGRPAIAALQYARASKRPEVSERAKWALRKIEGAEEEFPEDPELQKQVLAKKERIFFEEVMQRTEYALKRLRFERDKMRKLLNDSRRKLNQGRADIELLKYTDEKEKKALLEALEAVEEHVTELQAGFPEREEEKAEPEKEEEAEAGQEEREEPEKEEVEEEEEEESEPEEDADKEEEPESKEVPEEEKKEEKPTNRRAWESEQELEE